MKDIKLKYKNVCISKGKSFNIVSSIIGGGGGLNNSEVMEGGKGGNGNGSS